LTFGCQFSLIRRAMRNFLAVALIGALVAGCKSTKQEGATAEPHQPKRRVTTTTFPAQGDRPSVRPVQAVMGRIIAVREPLRFVVVDFGTAKMPKLDQILSVYRLDQKVAELRVSGPFLGTTVAADITAGEAHEGDLVREQ